MINSRKNSVKRAVSLPAKLDESLRGLARESGRSYSGVVAEAIRAYLASVDNSRMARAYADYYLDPSAAKEESSLAKDLSRASAPGWPDWMG